MKHSFKIFTVVIALLVIVIILRLNSISFPRDIEDNTDVIYLEEFHDFDSLFDIEYKNKRFFLEPHTDNIKVRGNPVKRAIEIKDSDLIFIGSRRFLFNVYPRTTAYREVFHRSLREVFRHAKEVKYIGGWTGTDRQTILAKQENQDLLKKLVVEISAEELKRLLPLQRDFDGKLLELGFPAGALQIKSPHLPVIIIRDWEELPIEKNTPFTVEEGDILKLPHREGNGENGLFIKINTTRSRGNDYLSISYKENISPFLPGKRGQDIAFIKSLDNEAVFNINTGKKNAFIGGRGLFSFNLEPKRLVNKLYIPDRIPEGGTVDIKELLDRDMYYRKENRFYAVSSEFLQELKKIVETKKDINPLRRYFAENRIRWRDFSSTGEFMDYAGAAEALIRKMENKGIFQGFTREIEKLNNRYQVRGLGLGVNRQDISWVLYKRPGGPWTDALPVKEDTPAASGIDHFYWGTLPGDSDDIVEFKTRFNKPVSSLRLLVPGDYGYSFNGTDYVQKNFFDGPQELRRPQGITELYVKIWNLATFNRITGSTNFQVEVVFEQANGKSKRIATDYTWKASIDTVHWRDVRVDPPYVFPDAAAGQLRSLWYDETWNPFYSGIKVRYFRKKFELESMPRSVRWNIYTFGDYILQVNGKGVRTEKEFLAALKKGKNAMTVMVTRKGFRKHFYVSPFFVVREDRVFLKHQRAQRTRLKGREKPLEPLITDNNRMPLAFCTLINGEPHRFYSPQAKPRLLSFFGSPEEGIWGLEQIFSRVYRENRLEHICLTIDSEWQAIAAESMRKILLANKEKETKDSEYQGLMRDLAAVNAQWQQKRREFSLSDDAARPTLMQTIIQLQNKIESLKQEINKIKNPFYEAAVVLMKPNGEILTAASYPYDDDTMKELNPHISKPYRPGENPYYNRSWEWKYNPGSTAKLIDCFAFLESKDRKDAKGRYLFPYLRALLSSAWSFGNFPRLDLQGSTMLNGKGIGFHLRNFEGHTIPPGFCTLEQALVHSYNTYFSYLALHDHRCLTHDSLVYNRETNPRHRWYFVSKGNIPITRTYEEYPVLECAEKLLLNSKIDLLYNLRETSLSALLERLPNDAFMAAESRFPVNAYTAADIAHYSIGQGDFQLTALQNAMIAATIYNRGVLYHPAVIKSLKFKDTAKELIPDPAKDKISIFSAAIADQIKAAMKEVVLQGTAGGLFHGIREGREFFAKTGTAETEVYQDNSLFVGFVIFTDGTPLIFSVIVPRSGLGARVAGKLTEDIIKTIIDYENKKGDRSL